MEPVRRARLRVRRLERTLARRLDNAFREPRFSLRTAMPGANTNSLRRTIETKVQAFVPPGPPLVTAEQLTCTDWLVELRSDGLWIINARVEAANQLETTFVAGFSVNSPRYFGFLIGVVNYHGRQVQQVTSANERVAVSIVGSSRWLSENFESACSAGVTFRIVSTTDDKIDLRFLARVWRSAFHAPLYRPMSLLDTGSYDDAWGVAPGMGSALEEDEGDRDGLSFTVSLDFE